MATGKIKITVAADGDHYTAGVHVRPHKGQSEAELLVNAIRSLADALNVQEFCGCPTCNRAKRIAEGVIALFEREEALGETGKVS